MNNVLSALKIHADTSTEAIEKEKVAVSDVVDGKDVTDYTMSTSEFIYPTMILVPLVIVIISLMALNISLLTKILLIFFLVVSLIVYILQFKQVNIEKPLANLANSLKKNEYQR
nr:hypothetical protein MmNV_45 [Menippe mercenaria nudivirus]